MNAGRAGFLAGFYFMGVMMLTYEFILLPLFGMHEEFSPAWRVGGYAAQGLFFGLSIGLFTFFIRKNLQRRFPASASDPEHLLVSREDWENFQKHPAVYLDSKRISFRPEGDTWIGRLGVDFWFDWSSRVLLRPLYQNDNTVVLSLRIKSRNLFGTPLYGYEIKVHHRLAQAFGIMG